MNNKEILLFANLLLLLLIFTAPKKERKGKERIGKVKLYFLYECANDSQVFAYKAEHFSENRTFNWSCSSALNIAV